MSAKRFFTSTGLIAALIVLALSSLIAVINPSKASAANYYAPNHLIDDYVMTDTLTMGQSDIQAFLAGKHSYLANYVTYSNRDNADVYASQIIYEASRDYGINPQVVLATMQKEESLVTAQSPTSSQLTHAMGYGCPDDGGCGSSTFFYQVDSGTAQFRIDFELSSGRSYLGYPPSSYPCLNATRYYSAGLIPGNNVTFYDDNGTPYSSFHIDNAATAALYCYTPHVYPGSPAEYYSGSQNFEDAFTNWGWSLYSNNCVGSSSSVITDTSFRKFQQNLDSGTFVIYTGTSTNCVEDHSWTPGSGFTQWQSHIISNLPVTSPSVGVVKFADLTGSGVDNPVFIGLNGTSTGMAEFHVWTPDMRQWIVHTASNLPLTASGTAPSAQNSSIEFGDLDGNGVDEPIAIQYKNTASGYVEFWIWNDGLQSWKQHIVTNLPAPLDPNTMQIGFDDIYGNGRDEAVAFGVSGTSTGNVEFHIWAPGEQSWQQHIVSNLPTSQLSGCSIHFADLSTSGFDNGIAVCTQGTASGRIEFHVWNPDLTTWQGHYVSNQSIL